MLRSMNDLQGFDVRATDGAVGRIVEFLFDDEKWTVRYAVVDTIGLTAHRVLVSPIALAHVDADERTIHASLTRAQVQGSPPPELHRPVSRQYEQDYFKHYGYRPYWGGTGYWGLGYYPAALGQARADVAPASVDAGADSHLRSSRDVIGHHIFAIDGEIGHVDDFLVNEESWAILYLRLDTSNWIGGKSVLVPRRAVREVSWPLSRVDVALTRDQIRESPSFDPARLNSEYERRLEDYYVPHT